MRVINTIRLGGTVIRSNNTHRQILIETNTLSANNHRSLVAGSNFKTSERVFVNVMDDSIALPAEGDRVTVNGLLKRVNFCDSSMVKIGQVPIMESSLSRLEVYSKEVTAGAERDINHAVLAGYVKGVYENVRGKFSTHGLVKLSLNQGPMMFVADGIMSNQSDRFPHGKETYHQYLQNRDLLIHRIVRNKHQGHLKKGDRVTNHQHVDNLSIIATGAIANVIPIEDDLDNNPDPIYQSRIFCFSLASTNKLKSPIDSRYELGSNGY